MSSRRRLALGAWIPAVLWMGLIIWFSSERWSTEHTGPVVTSVVQWVVPWFTLPQRDVIHAIVRKCAHLAEYAVLAIFCFRALIRGHQCSTARAAWGALAISVAWATLDEVHQALATSRRASPIDVLIDAVGAVLAIAVVSLTSHGARLLRTVRDLA